MILISPALLIQSQVVKPHCLSEEVWLDGYFERETYDGWVLVFEDTFDGDELDHSRWRNDYPWGRNLYCAPDVQYFTDGDNIELDSGILKLIVRADPVLERVVPFWEDDAVLYCGGDSVGLNKRWFEYTSGMIFSRQKFLHGKFEIRCSVPEIGGLWPAFWLYGSCAQEIDVFEYMSEYRSPFLNNRNIDFTYHRKPDCSVNIARHCNYDRFFATDMTREPHTYAVEWDEHRIIWSIDGQEMVRKSRWEDPNGKEMLKSGMIPPSYYSADRIFPFDDIAMNVIAGIGVKQNPTCSFPCRMEIDYIRIYQKINSAKTVRICSGSDIKGSTVAGQNIVVGGGNCRIEVRRGAYLDLVAKESIVLDAGFSAESGALFTARTTGVTE